MFGNFAANFGLEFPMQGADPQGGMFGPNTPVGPEAAQPGGGLPAPAPQPGSAPAAGMAAPSAAPQQSPLANPLGPGQAQMPMPEQQGIAPAAGMNSPLGKQAL